MDSAEFEGRIATMDSMDGWSESVRQELAKLISENPAKVIYHYTDARALIGMIVSGRILATHVSRLNDAMEYEIGVSFVRKFIGANLQRASKSIIDKAISQLRSVDTFIACYSATADVLSQWRAYSRTGTGYSTGLKTNEKATIDGRMPLLEKVFYSEPTAETVLSLLLARVEKFLGDHDFGEVEVGCLMGTLDSIFNIVACIIKYPAFEEENEYRQSYQSATSTLSLVTKYRMGRFGLTPYVELEFLHKETIPIQSIMIGPCRDPDSEGRSLRLMLAEHGYSDVEVFTSGIPLRV